MKTGSTGASEASWSTDRTRAVLKGIVERATRQGRDSEWVHAQFVEFMLSDGGKPHLEAVLRYYSVNTHRALVQATDRALALDERMRAADERARAVTAAVGEMKTRIRAGLMESVQANGKALGDCTAADLVRLGAWYARLAGRMRGGQIVRDRFTEAELGAAFAERRTA